MASGRPQTYSSTCLPLGSILLHNTQANNHVMTVVFIMNSLAKVQEEVRVC